MDRFECQPSSWSHPPDYDEDEEYYDNIVPQETYDALDTGPKIMRQSNEQQSTSDESSALEALSILSAQCGSAKIRNDKKKIIKDFIEMKPSTAIHMDHPENPTALQISLLKARLETIRIYGKDAMSDRDIKNGYTPESVEGLLLTTIKQQENIMTEQEQSAEGVSTETETKRGGASEVLKKASQIRRAVYLIRAQLKEIRKEAKGKITILEGSLAALLDDVDEKQLTMFDMGADLSPECQDVLDDPSL